MSEPPKAAPAGKLSADFIPVEDEKDALALLKEGAATLSAAMLWTKNQEKTMQTHLSAFIESERMIYLWVPPGEDPKDFAASLAQIGTDECYFSISAPRANVFFKAQFSGYDELGLKFKYPAKIFKVQRRKDFRFQIPDGHVLRIEFEDPLDSKAVFKPKVLDISAGGLAFLVNDTEEALFSAGLLLHQVSFTIKGRKIVTEAEVRHKRAMPDGSRSAGHKIGILFKDLKAADYQHIAAYAFEESRKYFSRFI